MTNKEILKAYKQFVRESPRGFNGSRAVWTFLAEYLLIPLDEIGSFFTEKTKSILEKEPPLHSNKADDIQTLVTRLESDLETQRLYRAMSDRMLAQRVNEVQRLQRVLRKRNNKLEEFKKKIEEFKP
jgi:hypothetical protein